MWDIDWRTEEGVRLKVGNFHFLRGWFWAIFGWNSRFFNLQNSRSLLKLVGCISFSSHQTYTTMYEVEGKTEEDIKWILDIFIFSGVILVNLQLKFQHFQPSELEKCTKIGRDASYFPHTKLLQPCMGLKAKQKRISGENLTFFQGVVFQWDFS